MEVSEAVDRRRSIRQFLPDPVDDGLLRSLVERAARAPSGGNVQPWRIYLVNGEAMVRFKEHVAASDLEAPAYDIYPPGLHEPYRTNRFAVGEQMYSLLGIPRDDKGARLMQVAKNYELFGAPAGMFCFVDRKMGPPQWSDLGMFLQTFMLLAVEAGLDTCAQESWAMYERAVAEFVGAPLDDEGIFCGMAIGHRDPDAPVNDLRSERMSVDDFARFVR
ncbi:MAG: nitroreductase [Actinomycetota bacterium]